jgi:RTA1 like protein
VETVGYVGRIYSINNITSKTAFIMQSVLIVLAPAFFSATVYMILGRVIAFINAPQLSIVPHRWLTTIFVLGDVLSFLVQGSGAGFMAGSSSSSRNTGSLIIVGGLVIQLIFFGVFFIALIVFDFRCRRRSLRKSIVFENGNTTLHWHTVIVALYIASTLISIRCVFRAIEFATGFDGYLQSHEVFFYVFDALPMAATLIIFNIIVPGYALKGERRELGDVPMTLGMGK